MSLERNIEHPFPIQFSCGCFLTSLFDIYCFFTDIQRYSVASSRSLVLKQCLQLPTPLWQEVLLLLGGRYAREAQAETDEGEE
jgi:hypothetical protein